jgi:nicotinamidase-related amidase
MLDIEQSVLIVMDVQGKLARMMHDTSYLNHISAAMKVAHLLEIPIIATEQAPEKIGSTIDEIRALVPGIPIIHKETFSCYPEPSFIKKIESLGRRQVIITGIEAHGCVWQSTHDFLHHQYEVFIIVDAVSAHSALDKDIGLRRCERQGAVLTTVEMMATELIRTARHPKFKEVMMILKEYFRK